MNKPISLKLKDFKNDMVTLINTSGLPLFVVEPIVKDVLNAVQIKMEQEYQQDKLIYENSFREEAKKIQEQPDNE